MERNATLKDALVLAIIMKQIGGVGEFGNSEQRVHRIRVKFRKMMEMNGLPGLMR